MRGQLRFEQDEFLLREEALEERILCPRTKTGQNFMYLRTPPVLRDVVGNDVARRLAGRHQPGCHVSSYLPDDKWWILRDFASQILCDQSRLEFDTSPVFRFIAKDGMSDLLVQSLLKTRQKEFARLLFQTIRS